MQSHVVTCAVVVFSCIFIQGCARNSDDFLRSGLANQRQHKFAEALSDFNNAIRLDSNCAGAYLGRGLIACKTGFTHPVEDDLSKYLRLTAHDMAIAYIGRGMTKYLQHDSRSAIYDLDRAIAVDTGNIQGFIFKQQVLSESGDSVGLSEFRKGLDPQTLTKMKDYAATCRPDSDGKLP